MIGLRIFSLFSGLCLSVSSAPAIALQTSSAFSAEAQSIIASSPASDWRVIPNERLLLVEFDGLRVLAELYPDLAPRHVERVAELAQAEFYDGIKFHRVIRDFIVQGGDPNGDGTGGSELPNIAGEYVRDVNDTPAFTVLGRDLYASRAGFLNGLPVAAHPESLRTAFGEERPVKIWGAHCPGILSMARASDPDSANSQFFVMLGDHRRSLDRLYTVFGRVVIGVENLEKIAEGEPPKNPTVITRMRIASELPSAQQVSIREMKADSASFRSIVELSGDVSDGFVRNLCALKLPIRMD